MTKCEICNKETEQVYTTPDGEKHFICGKCVESYDEEDIIVMLGGALFVEDFGLFGW